MSDYYYIGLMSGTSLDGVDAALVDLSAPKPVCLGTVFTPYSKDFKQSVLALHQPQHNELETSLLVANQVALLYSNSVDTLLNQSHISAKQISAIGAHGQTVRHRPELGFSLQLLNGARLAELTKIPVVYDFRSRDIAAEGQGAPLVPAFHHAVFASQQHNRAIVNIGGISNVTYLPIEGTVIGYDTGPGNLLLDQWTQLKLNNDYDANGDWAASGKVIESMLTAMQAEPFFNQPPPKSTGRDLFNADWLRQHIIYPHFKPEDVACTLVEFTALTIVRQTERFCGKLDELYLCGGGVHNHLLVDRIKTLSKQAIYTTQTLGVEPDWVEAIAFAWLAKQWMDGKSSNLPAVTGAAGPRILGTMSLA